ncbi:MAG: type IVB secretion system apparatus protein IcmL/DotI [Coxiellaceae bacterium]|nr:type IVB secretion system apparatus protein IcmL/DotI [Coxiellaceae bacterium]
MAIDYDQLEQRKNYFFRDSYRKLLNLTVFLLWLGLVMAVVLAAMVLTPGSPRYFASTTTGEQYILHPLNEPVVTDDFVMKWASLLATQVYSLNFEDYQKQLDAAKGKFTDHGWNALQAALKDSGFLKSLTQNKVVTSAVVTAAPVISMREILHHRYTWVIEFPLLVAYGTASEAQKRTINIQMRVMRVPVLDVPAGIQCDVFVAQAPV